MYFCTFYPRNLPYAVFEVVQFLIISSLYLGYDVIFPEQRMDILDIRLLDQTIVYMPLFLRFCAYQTKTYYHATTLKKVA